MPLDMIQTNVPSELLLPEYLDFPVEYEPTRVHDKKYAINGYSGEPYAVVGVGFNCANHGEFFNSVAHVITEDDYDVGRAAGCCES